MKQETISVFHSNKDDFLFKYKMKNIYPGYSDSAQTYDELKIVHIIQGSVIWHIGKKDYTATADDIIIFSRLDERYISKILSQDALLVEQIEFSPMTIYPIQNCADFFFKRPDGFSNILSKNNEHHRYILKCFENMRNEFKEEKLYQRENIIHYLTGIIIAAARICCDSKEKKHDYRYNIVSKTMTYINDNLNGDLSRETLAKKQGISPSYMSRLFKEYSGVYLQEYIVQCRVQKAILLLKTGKYNIISAALESGFTSSSGFYRAFHKVTGKKPKDIYKNTL